MDSQTTHTPSGGSADAKIFAVKNDGGALRAGVKNGAPVSGGQKKEGRPQADVAEALGISLEELKLYRDVELVEGEDWFDGRPVLIAASGEKKLRAGLGVPLEEATSDGAGGGTGAVLEAVAKAGKEKVELVVIRPARGTVRVVMCTDPRDKRTVEKGNVCWLQVKNSVHFVKGMKVPNCVPHATVNGQFIYEGRLPRWKGRF